MFMIDNHNKSNVENTQGESPDETRFYAIGLINAYTVRWLNAGNESLPN